MKQSNMRGSMPVDIYGLKFCSVKAACAALGGICSSTFCAWRRRSSEISHLSTDEQFVMWLKQNYGLNLVLLLLNVIRSRSAVNRTQYALDLIRQNDRNAKSVEEYLASFGNIEISMMTIPTLLEATKLAKVDPLEVACLKCLWNDIPLELLLKAPLMDCYYLGEHYED